jgi:DNA-binding transcriptional ArsR family regulator
VTVIDTVILYAPVMSYLYIPPEIAEKHRLVAAVRQPASAALTMRLGGDDSSVRRPLSQLFANKIVSRIKIKSEERDYGDTYLHLGEIFVFTREELAEILESRYIRMEPLRLP